MVLLRHCRYCSANLPWFAAIPSGIFSSRFWWMLPLIFSSFLKVAFLFSKHWIIYTQIFLYIWPVDVASQQWFPLTLFRLGGLKYPQRQNCLQNSENQKKFKKQLQNYFYYYYSCGKFQDRMGQWIFRISCFQNTGSC